MSVPPAGPFPLRAVLQLVLLVVLTLLVPLGLRGMNARYADDTPASSFPLAEGPRMRMPFEPSPIGELAGMDPGIVVIGDSMAGSRVDHRRLAELSGLRVAPLLQAGSGPVWWYLALKNWVIASGIHPRVVFIFFRDTNLTSIHFRMDEAFRWNVDRVALDREDEVDQAIAAAAGPLRARVGAAIDEAYGARRARTWVEPAISTWVGRVMIPSRRQRTAFMADMNARFGFEHARPMEAADLEATQDREADFDAHVDRSVLPLMLRDARRAGLTLCFVRVQRRPDGAQPPAQSPALRRYVAELQAYIEANGGIWRDDTADPAITSEALYEDGDHLARHAQRYYTEILHLRLRAILQ
jgi:hypothetical protein